MIVQDSYSSCTLCPHNCGVDRLSGKRGLCGETDELRIASAGLHFGEEPPLTGGGGSGTIFLSGCSMSCPFCQNYQISRSGSGSGGGGIGRVVKPEEFREICQALKEEGAENLNLVSPSHMAPTLAAYMRGVQEVGVMLPVAWNSSGYESVETVDTAAGFTDIWLPDLKTLDEDVSRRIYGIRGYPEAAASAILKMAGYGRVEVNPEGRMLRGLMLRHLILPGELDSTRGVLSWFAEELKGRAWLSLMSQYTPVYIPGENRLIPDRQLNESEYERVLEWLEEFGIDDGFVQELVPGEDWLPDFRQPNPFSSDLSRIIWTWDRGFIRD